MLKKILNLVLMILFSSSFLFGQQTGYDISTNFKFLIDHEDVKKERAEYDLEGELEIEYRITGNLMTIFSIELDRYKVDVEEVSIVYEATDGSEVKFGRFDSTILLTDLLKKRYTMFYLEAPGARYIRDLGYSNLNTGVEYRNDTFVWNETGFHASMFFNSAHVETQFIATGIYNIDKDRNFFALTASYLPFIVHQTVFGEKSEYQFNNILFNGKYFNYGENFVFAGEAAFGSNLIDPIGILHQPGGERSFFASADFACGINLYGSNFIYTPAVRGGILFPKTDNIDANRVDIILGNFIHGKHIFFNVDAGLRFDTYYDAEDLVTALEILWGVSFRVRS